MPDHLQRANELRQKGDLDGAIGAYCEAIRLEPGNAAAHAGLADALRAHGDIEEAIAEYRVALNLDPDNPGLRRNLFFAYDRARSQFAGRRFYVVLREVGPRRTEVIRALRALMPLLTIPDALQLLTGLPKTVKEAAFWEEADALQQRLASAGATAEMGKHTVPGIDCV